MNGRMRTDCRAILKMYRLQQRMTWILMERNPNTEEDEAQRLPHIPCGILRGNV